MIDIPNRAALTCQIRTNIRFKREITWQELKGLFKGTIPFDEEKHGRYIAAFFEECCPRSSPRIIKNFMMEQDISRDEILRIFYKLPPNLGATFDFREAIDNGKYI